MGRSKRYATTGKNPLMCVELKCPDDVADKAAFFQQELEKLTKDIQVKKPTMPKGTYLINKDNLKVCFTKKDGAITAWISIKSKGLMEIRRELYTLTSEIDKCFAFNSGMISQQ